LKKGSRLQQTRHVYTKSTGNAYVLCQRD